MPVVQTSVFAKFPSKWPHCYSCITLGLKKVEIDVLKIKKIAHKHNFTEAEFFHRDQKFYCINVYAEICLFLL